MPRQRKPYPEEMKNAGVLSVLKIARVLDVPITARFVSSRQAPSSACDSETGRMCEQGGNYCFR